MTADPARSFESFWLHYLGVHRDWRTRAIHMAGTGAALTLLAAALATLDWRPLVVAPLVGYGAAWSSHAFIERNRPATFGKPLWSLASDLRMLFLFLAGRLGPELKRAGVA